MMRRCRGAFHRRTMYHPHQISRKLLSSLGSLVLRQSATLLIMPNHSTKIVKNFLHNVYINLRELHNWISNISHPVQFTRIPKSNAIISIEVWVIEEQYHWHQQRRISNNNMISWNDYFYQFVLFRRWMTMTLSQAGMTPFFETLCQAWTNYNEGVLHSVSFLWMCGNRGNSLVEFHDMHGYCDAPQSNWKISVQHTINTRKERSLHWQPTSPRGSDACHQDPLMPIASALDISKVTPS